MWCFSLKNIKVYFLEYGKAIIFQSEKSVFLKEFDETLLRIYPGVLFL